MNDKVRPPIRVLVIDDEAPVLDAYQQIFAAPTEDPSARRNLGPSSLAAKRLARVRGSPPGR